MTTRSEILKAAKANNVNEDQIRALVIDVSEGATFLLDDLDEEERATLYDWIID